MYSRWISKLSRFMTCTSEKPRCHTSPLYPKSWDNRCEKPALHQLQRFLNGHLVVNGQQQMQMIGHDDKIVQFKLALRNKRTQYINEQLRIALRLQEPASHAVPVVTKNVREGLRMLDGDAFLPGCAMAGAKARSFPLP